MAHVEPAQKPALIRGKLGMAAINGGTPLIGIPVSGNGWSWGNKTSEHQNDRITEEYVPPSDFLPSFVQGWFLLQDSGLEPGEKNMILAALKDNFSVDRVAQELRNQWADDDIRKRDLHGPRGSAYWMGEDPDDDDAGEAGT